LILQGKLLRVLQEKEIRRVGGTKNISIDVRVIAASNTNLEQMVVQGTFRADLYYRFAVITLDIPPLRERLEDILPLARHFIRNEAASANGVPTLSNEAANLLMAYAWPGNVRELENAIKHAITFLQDDVITPELLPPRIVSRATEVRTQQDTQPTLAGSNTSLKGFLKLKEKEYLEQILSTTNGDKEKAAQTLQVSLATLYRKLSDDEVAASAK
jgi:transcriptional regulator with PAS, ATPase and Fis domain